MRKLIGPHLAATRYWHSLDDGRVQCDLCPRFCKLHDGQHGLCFVRENRHGQIVMSSYGRSSGFAIDPIEKKPLNHFLPGTGVLSFGTPGCNLGCRYCQNYSLSRARVPDRLADHASPEQVAATAVACGARSVAFTYNDPVVYAEYAVDCAQAAREVGLRSVAVTAGYISPGPRAMFFKHMDAANVDLKAFSEEFYHRQCLGELTPVLDTLAWIRRETQVWLEVTTLLIPGLNDTEREIGRLCDWFLRVLGPSVPLHFSAFHPDYKLLDIERTPPSTLHAARAQARAAGIQHVYTGNIADVDGQSTSCAWCGRRAIGRAGYGITSWRVAEGGRCAGCGEELPGVFEATPGGWGNRREPIQISAT